MKLIRGDFMKTFKRLVVSIVSFSLTVSLTGCGIIREMMSILNGSYPEETSRSEPASYEKVETMIGKDGGVVKDEKENVTISIPQGALQEDTNISAQYIEEPSYLEANPSMNFLGAVEFGPSGITFDKPVEVSLQLTDTPKNNKISIFCYSEEYDIWDYVTDASVSNNIATFNISHFSKYKALDISMEMLMKFNDLVRQAQATGQSDSWIHENFKNYLINEEHVMDIYSYFGGYWYEPCGLIIGGNYHINGKEGDPNELTELIGETNKVGNTYGLCHDGQLIVDSKTYKKIAGQPKEGQETISVNVGVYYKMIKPDIDLTASKKKLNKGENATINIRCHYVNVTNYFDEYKDLEMSNYMLTIAKPSHFDIDKSAVLTDDEGLASFVVTAKENNKAETITVNFDVAGDFGTHAEGNITLNSEGKTINGHIKQEKTLTYGVLTGDTGFTVDYHQEGYFQMVVEYDFEGNITEDKDTINGNIQISNVSLTLVTEHLLADLIYDGVPVTANDMDYFNEKNSPTVYEPEISFVAVKNNDTEVSALGTSFDKIAEITGSHYLEIKSLLPQNYGKVSSHSEIPFHITILAGTALLLPFDLVTGEYTSSSTSLKDTAEIIFGEEGGANEPFETLINRENTILSQSEETTQTITVA